MGSYLRLLQNYIGIAFKRLVEYRADFGVLFASSLVTLAVSVLFWQVVFSQARLINGWTLGDVILLEGFFTLAMAFVGLFGEGLSHFGEEVIHGWFDTYLTKPASPILISILTHIELFELQSFALSATYFLAAASFGTSVTLWGFLAGIVITLLGAFVMLMIITSLAMLVFWFGRTSALHVLFSVIYEAGGGTPGTIYPGAVQLAFTIGLPVFFMQTFPAMAALGRLDTASLLGVVAAEIAIALAWFGIALFAYKRGLRRYESYGG